MVANRMSSCMVSSCMKRDTPRIFGPLVASLTLTHLSIWVAVPDTASCTLEKISLRTRHCVDSCKIEANLVEIR